MDAAKRERREAELRGWGLRPRQDAPERASQNSPSMRDTLPYYWLYLVIGAPYLILAWVYGFGPSFKTGAASFFICGAIIAAAGENLIDQVKDGFARLRASLKSRQLNIPVVSAAVSLGFLGWNMYFAVADKTVKHPSIDWVQIVVFICAAIYLPPMRFMFTEFSIGVAPSDGAASAAGAQAPASPATPALVSGPTPSPAQQSLMAGGEPGADHSGNPTGQTGQSPS